MFYLLRIHSETKCSGWFRLSPFDLRLYLTNHYKLPLCYRKHWLHIILLHCCSFVNLVIGVFYAFFPYHASTVSIQETCIAFCVLMLKMLYSDMIADDPVWSCITSKLQTFNCSTWRAFHHIGNSCLKADKADILEQERGGRRKESLFNMYIKKNKWKRLLHLLYRCLCKHMFTQLLWLQRKTD